MPLKIRRSIACSRNSRWQLEMRAALQAAAGVFFGAGAQSSGCFFRYVSAGEGFKVTEEERNHLMVVDDFEQIRPIEGLLG